MLWLEIVCKLSSFRFSCTCPSEAGPGVGMACVLIASWETCSSIWWARVGPQSRGGRSQRSTYSPAASPQMSLNQTSPWQSPHRSCPLPLLCAWNALLHPPPGWPVWLHCRAQHTALSFQEDPYHYLGTQSSPFTELPTLSSCPC